MPSFKEIQQQYEQISHTANIPKDIAELHAALYVVHNPLDDSASYDEKLQWQPLEESQNWHIQFYLANANASTPKTAEDWYIKTLLAGHFHKPEALIFAAKTLSLLSLVEHNLALMQCCINVYQDSLNRLTPDTASSLLANIQHANIIVENHYLYQHLIEKYHSTLNSPVGAAPPSRSQGSTNQDSHATHQTTSLNSNNLMNHHKKPAL